jgi:hypothetical protein
VNAFAHALDAIFDDANFGRAARYTPPGGIPVACRVIKNTRDREPSVGFGRPVLQGTVIEVRKSEVSNPVQGGVFVPGDIIGGVFVPGDETFVIQGDPTSEDPDRLVWTCTVS